MLPSYVTLDSGTYTVLYNGTSKQGSTCCVAVALLRNQGLCCMWDMHCMHVGQLIAAALRQWCEAMTHVHANKGWHALVTSGVGKSCKHGLTRISHLWGGKVMQTRVDMH